VLRRRRKGEDNFYGFVVRALPLSLLLPLSILLPLIGVASSGGKASLCDCHCGHHEYDRYGSLVAVAVVVAVVVVAIVVVVVVVI